MVSPGPEPRIRYGVPGTCPRDPRYGVPEPRNPNTTIGPRRLDLAVKSVTNTVLDPIDMGQSASQASLSIPSPATATMAATQAPNLEAQVLTPSVSGSATSNRRFCPRHYPEPGTLLIFSVMLAPQGCVTVSRCVGALASSVATQVNSCN